MSWILRHKKIVLAFIILAILTVVYLLLGWAPVVPIVVWAVLLIVAVLNELVCREMRQQRAPFQSTSPIRNVDYLLIGENVDPHEVVPVGETYVQIAIPKMGLFSATRILEHTHSILKEDAGHVVICCAKSDEQFSLFDIPFLHLITIKKYHLEGMKKKSRLPIIFAPIRSCKMILAVKKSISTYCEWHDDYLSAFCAERSYTLQCYLKG